jgi:NAD(P)-dependent dehydrogenase (short-subunit alcohol dehydrogenase family)
MKRTRTKPKPPFPPQRNQRPPGQEHRLRPRPQFDAPDYYAAGKLRDKVALITGADSGIGRSVAVLYAREGADVVIAHLPQEKTDASMTVASVKAAGRRGIAIAGDVRSVAFCERLIHRTITEYGKLDIVVNNAAFQCHRDRIEDITKKQWDRTFQTNIYGYFHIVQAALPHLKRGGVIINTGSITGLEGSDGLLDYSSTKGAIHAFTKTLAKMLVNRGIRVNCVAPGPVWTPLNPAERGHQEVKTFGSDTPMGRPAQPEEIAPAYVFFASAADSGYITGEVLTLLGGETTAA